MTPNTKPIEMGKKYRTLDGQPVQILAINAPAPYPVVGVLNGKDVSRWTATGGAYMMRLQLVEVATVERYKNLYADGSTTQGEYDTLARAQHAESKAKARIGILKITVLDGKPSVEVLPAPPSKYS